MRIQHKAIWLNLLVSWIIYYALDYIFYKIGYPTRSVIQFIHTFLYFVVASYIYWLLYKAEINFILKRIYRVLSPWIIFSGVYFLGDGGEERELVYILKSVFVFLVGLVFTFIYWILDKMINRKNKDISET